MFFLFFVSFILGRPFLILGANFTFIRFQFARCMRFFFIIRLSTKHTLSAHERNSIRPLCVFAPRGTSGGLHVCPIDLHAMQRYKYAINGHDHAIQIDIIIRYECSWTRPNIVRNPSGFTRIACKFLTSSIWYTQTHCAGCHEDEA